MRIVENFIPNRQYYLNPLGKLDIYGKYENFRIKVKDTNKIDLFDSQKNITIFDLSPVYTISFSNLYDIEINTKRSFPAYDIIKVDNKTGPYLISHQEILSNDQDWHGRDIFVYNVTNSKGGSVRLEKNNIIKFEPLKDFNDIMSFEYQVINSARTIMQDKVKVYFKTENLPNDTNFFEQWYLFRSNIPQVWNHYTGKNITISVLDGGLPFIHSDILDNIDLVVSAPLKNSWIDGIHGTQVASIIAARNNDKDLVGVAYNSKINLYLQIGQFEDISYAFEKAAENSDIINNSWITELNFCTEQTVIFCKNQIIKLKFSQAIEKSLTTGRGGLGTLVVFAAGNDFSKGYDSSIGMLSPFGIINVGGFNKPHEQYFGDKLETKFATSGSSILISAPASHISILSGINCNLNTELKFGCEEITDNVAGTSFSAPIVSGIIALMLEANPNLGWRDVQEILAISAKYFDDETTSLINIDFENEWLINHASNWNNGGMHFSRHFGFGEVDARSSVKFAESWPLIQTSANYFDLKSHSPQIIEENIAPQKRAIINLPINLNSQVESIKLNLNIGLKHLNFTINLISPFRTNSTLLNLSKIEGKVEGFINFELISNHYRGESSQGIWYLEIINNIQVPSNIDPKIANLMIRSYDFSIYTKDCISSTSYFTDEFTKFAEKQHERLNVDSKVKTINAASVTFPIEINLNNMQQNSFANYTLNLANNSSLVNIFTGDGDDRIIDKYDQDNIYMLGNGLNEIIIKSGNDVIYFPNLDSLNGFTIIHNFNSNTKLQFGNYNFSQITSNIKCSVNKESCLRNNVDCQEGQEYIDHFSCEFYGNNWKIFLGGLNTLLEENVIFGHLFIDN